MLLNKQKLTIAVLACFVALTLATNEFSFASIQLHRILQEIKSPLDSIGVGVFCCQQARGSVPKVGLLEDMHFEQMPKANREAWEEEFSRGWFGRILFLSKAGPASRALQYLAKTDRRATTTSGPSEEEQFRSAWEQAPTGRKIALSFTRDDLELANKIEEALRSKGYTVFKYLNEEGGPPKYTAEDAGRMFSEADVRLVLDTPNAQMSVGVRFEAELDEQRRSDDAARVEEELRAGAARAAAERLKAQEEAEKLGTRGNADRFPKEIVK
jgi:hypothetical protein